MVIGKELIDNNYSYYSRRLKFVSFLRGTFIVNDYYFIFPCPFAKPNGQGFLASLR